MQPGGPPGPQPPMRPPQQNYGYGGSGIKQPTFPGGAQVMRPGLPLQPPPPGNAFQTAPPTSGPSPGGNPFGTGSPATAPPVGFRPGAPGPGPFQTAPTAGPPAPPVGPAPVGPPPIARPLVPPGGPTPTFPGANRPPPTHTGPSFTYTGSAAQPPSGQPPAAGLASQAPPGSASVPYPGSAPPQTTPGPWSATSAAAPPFTGMPGNAVSAMPSAGKPVGPPPPQIPAPNFSSFRPPPPGAIMGTPTGSQQSFPPSYPTTQQQFSSSYAVAQQPQSTGPPPPQYAQPAQQGFIQPTPAQFASGGAPHPYQDGYAGSNFGGAAPPPPTQGYDATKQLVEEFQSLSMTPHPGSMTEAVDPGALPRPVDNPDKAPFTSLANADPRFVRLTCNVIPNAQSLRNRWQLPLGAVIHPLAPTPPGEEVPVVNFGASGIVRCRRCRTYVNPYVTFTDGGRRWRCNVCGLLNEVPADYFCVLDQNGRRRDLEERPELCRGSVEFVAPAEYMVRPPMPPAYFFLIDVSATAVATGMLQIAADTIKACLDSLPGDSRTQIGFLTFDSALHFFSLKASLTQPQMMVVAELEDPFLPMPDDLLVNLSESREVVDALLDSLPSMFQSNTNIESALGPALKATYMIMSQLGGKLLIFQSQLPSLGIGRLRLRGDDPRIYNTDREMQLRVTDDPFYKQMAAECSRVQISVNVYTFSAQYTDLASLGTLSKYTGGQVYYYPGFTPALHGEKFRRELTRDLTRETAWEAVMRIRCGKGLRISNFHGHFFIRSTDLLALPAVDCDKGFAIQISHEDTLLSTQTVYFQCALLYTSSSGERRIRVHTVASPVVGDLMEMYRACDSGAITNLLGKIAIEKTMTAKLEEARSLVQQKCVAGLREYRNCHTQHRLTGRLIYPETLKLLPVYSLALVKCMALRGGFQEVTADERCAAVYEMMNMPIDRMLRYLYPLLIRLDDMPPECGKPGKNGRVLLPPALPLAVDRLDPRGAYLLDNGLQAILWLGKVLPGDFPAQVLGPAVASTADLSNVLVRPQANDLSKRVVAILDALREGNAAYQECCVVRQGEMREQMVLSNLVEDRGPGSLSYVEWIVQVHRLAQQKA